MILRNLWVVMYNYRSPNVLPNKSSIIHIKTRDNGLLIVGFVLNSLNDRPSKIKQMKFKSKNSVIVYCLAILFITGCNDDGDAQSAPCETPCPCSVQDFLYTEERDCTDQIYPNPLTSPYVIPFAIGTSFSMGLSNCSSSFHGPGSPDQHAFDFDLDIGVEFIAARAGKVVKVVENQESNGGDGGGNYVVIDHLDNTFGLYYHSPRDGISVDEGQNVAQGELLGLVGRSGLAGYSHLHFIVVKDGYAYPYTGLAVSFSNVNPMMTVLQSYTDYTVCQ